MDSEIEVTLHTNDANRMKKWGSLWADLLHTAMSLHSRQQIEESVANVYIRRALWEAALISYGRMEVSAKKRKVDWQEIVGGAGGQDALDFHADLMNRRHHHVAHRYDPDFEDVAVTATYSDGQLTHMHVVVSSDVGPHDRHELARKFREHVDLIRNHLWEKYLAPWGETLAERAKGEPAPSESSNDLLEATPTRLVSAMDLWDHVNGRGLA